MRTVLFPEIEGMRIEGEILVVVYGTDMQPLEALVLGDDGVQYAVDFDWTRSGRTFYQIDGVRNPAWQQDGKNVVYSDWVLYDQHPWDERHYIYSRLPLRGEDGSAIDSDRAALMGWVVLGACWIDAQVDPFASAFGGLAIPCAVCLDTFLAPDVCEHIEAQNLELAAHNARLRDDAMSRGVKCDVRPVGPMVDNCLLQEEPVDALAEEDSDDSDGSDAVPYLVVHVHRHEVPSRSNRTGIL